ncbi:hypothetical protein [Williamsia sp.]|uniref:hypothetical protein n=1 Tax=Williamsia sp. TaxID=1872085 RepID=UPI002F9215C8
MDGAQHLGPPPHLGPPEYSGRPPRERSRTGLVKSVAVIVVVAVLAAAGFAINRLFVAQFNGSTSASESVEDFLNAAEDKDWSRLGLLLPPDETFQLAGLFGDTADLQRRAGLTSDTFDDQLDGVEVDISDLAVSSRSLSTDLAKVSIDRATVVVKIDAKTVESLSDLIPGLDADDVGAIEYTATIDGPAIRYSLVVGTERQSGMDPVVIGGNEQAPFLMSVRRDGSWFVSPMFTVAQYVAEELGWEATDPGTSEVTYDSPAAAADGFVEGLVETIETSDINHVADAMGGVESRLLKTYAAGINHELAGDDFGFGYGEGVDLEIRDTDYSVSPGENGQARITVEQIRVAARDGAEVVDVEFDGDCLSVDSGGESEGGCISDGGEFSTRVHGALGHVVAVPVDGGWKISPVGTFFDWIGLIGQEIAGLDGDLLKALTRLDFSGIVGREPAGTLDPDDEVVVDVEPVSDAIHAGIVVLEPTPTDDLVDFSCAADAVPGFCEVIVVDADGRLQDRESRYDYDDGSRFGYEVSEGTRVVVLAVAGKVMVRSERW